MKLVVALLFLMTSSCLAKHGIYFTENQIDNVYNTIQGNYGRNLEIFTSGEEVELGKVDFFFHSDDKIIPTISAPGKEVNVYFFKNNGNKLAGMIENYERLSTFDLIYVESMDDLKYFIEEANPILVELASRSLYVPLIRFLGPISGYKTKINAIVNRIRGELPFKEYILEALPIFKTKNIEIKAKSESDNVAVIVESAVHPALELVVRNVMYYLVSGWSLIIYHSQENEFFIKSALKDLPNIEYRLPYFPIHSVPEYNQFMKMAKFYESLDAKKVLIFQTDSIMLKRGIENFMKYDYVGAPWWHLKKCGNGGFSLRSVNVMIKACNEACNAKNSNVNEDLIFSEYTSKHFNLAPFKESFSFSRETRIPTLDHMSGEKGVLDGHLAVHQTWLFTNQNIIRRILKHSIENLKKESN